MLWEEEEMVSRFAKAAKWPAAAMVLALGPTAFAQYYPPMSIRCFTAQFWCQMPYAMPVGSNCFCPSQYGAVPGIVR